MYIVHLIGWSINNTASSIKNTLDTKTVKLIVFKTWRINISEISSELTVKIQFNLLIKVPHTAYQ